MRAVAIALQPARLVIGDFVALAKPRTPNRVLHHRWRRARRPAADDRLGGRQGGAEALLLTTFFLLAAIRFGRRRNASSARWLFVASLLYLPLLWGALLINRL